MISTHQSVTIPVASGSIINGVTGEKEGIKVKGSSKIGNEWTNHKERGGFGDSWYCCLSSITVSRVF